MDVCSEAGKVAYSGSRFRTKELSNKRCVPAQFMHLMTPPQYAAFVAHNRDACIMTRRCIVCAQ